jgi:uncharacterized protein with HEPN domain
MCKDRDIRDYLNDMAEMLSAIQEFTGDMSFEMFRDDRKTIYAVVRAFEVLGEAARHIPDATRQSYTDVPWTVIAAFRNKLIHEYFSINLDILWDTIQNDVPALQALLTPVVKECFEKYRL